MILDSRPFLASPEVGQRGWGLQLGPNRPWLGVGQADGGTTADGAEYKLGLELGFGMPSGQHVAPEKQLSPLQSGSILFTEGSFLLPAPLKSGSLIQADLQEAV